MVFRKPYAFLIKNFRKIHIFILIMFLYIFYKTLQLRGFIKEFIAFLSYNKELEPITKYTSPLFFVMCILSIVVLIMIVSLLRKKDKPWKLYLIGIASCFVQIILFYYTYSYFQSYNGEVVRKTAKAINDFLFISTILQYGTFLVLIIRILGLDLNKFSFQNDKEFLDFSEDDKEEFEVSVKFDKGVIIRTYYKLKRNLGYFYQEHKFILNTVAVLFLACIVGTLVYYFMFTHKTIKETSVLSANGYDIRVNRSYYTDKDLSGNIIQKDSSFVVLNITIKNNGRRRALNTDNFHLINGVNDYTSTRETYVNSFSDLGDKYTKREFDAGENRTFAMIFKVSKKLKMENFVLYYQEYKSSNNVYLRKIKINLVDLSNIKSNGEKALGDEVVVKYPTNVEKKFTLEKADLLDSTSYNVENCKYDSCDIVEQTVTAKEGKKILQIEFSSTDFEGKELIDFSHKYGKIVYIDNENFKRELSIEDSIKDKDYLNNALYIKIPKEVEAAQKIQIIYVVRNQKYTYNIR